MFQRFNIKAKRRRDCVDRFTVDPLQNGGLPGIVKTASMKMESYIIRYTEERELNLCHHTRLLTA
jgi:hypothetical protein